MLRLHLASCLKLLGEWNLCVEVTRSIVVLPRLLSYQIVDIVNAAL